MELILRVSFSLLVVFGLMWFLARLARRSGLRGGNDGTLSVLHRRQLGKGSAVAIVEVAGRALVLGITDAQVNLLCETDLADLRQGEAGDRGRGRADLRRTAVPVQAKVTDVERCTDITDIGMDLNTLTDRLAGADAYAYKDTAADTDANANANANAFKDTGAGAYKDIGAPERRPGGRLAGSALSPQTWATAVEVLRARTVRKS